MYNFGFDPFVETKKIPDEGIFYGTPEQKNQVYQQPTMNVIKPEPQQRTYSEIAKMPFLQPKQGYANPSPAPQPDYVKQILMQSYPEPYFDAERQERIRRAAKMNQLGRGFSVFGDILSTALGGNVARRQPDQTTPALWSSYMSYLDDYRRRQEAWRYHDMDRKLRAAQYMQMRDDRQEQLDAQREYQRSQIGIRQNEQALKLAKIELDEAYRQGETERAIIKAEEIEKLKRETNRQKTGLDLSKGLTLEKARSETKEKEKDAMILYSDIGEEVYAINKKSGEHDKILSLILSDPAIPISTDDKNLMKAQTGMLTSWPEGLKTILINKYWQQSPGVMDYISKGEYSRQRKSDEFVGPQPFQEPTKEQQLEYNRYIKQYGPGTAKIIQDSVKQPVYSKDWENIYDINK